MSAPKVARLSRALSLLALAGCAVDVVDARPGDNHTTPIAIAWCPAGETFCAGSYCADLASDQNNCGQCGLKCPFAEPWCVRGYCR